MTFCRGRASGVGISSTISVPASLEAGCPSGGLPPRSGTCSHARSEAAGRRTRNTPTHATQEEEEEEGGGVFAHHDR
jgi:hypothetical protein